MIQPFSCVRIGNARFAHVHFTVDGERTLCDTSVLRTIDTATHQSRLNPDYFHQAHGPVSCMDCMGKLNSLAREKAVAR